MKRNKKIVTEKLGLGFSRGKTFVGFRPTVFKDKSKYNRTESKTQLRKEMAL